MKARAAANVQRAVPGPTATCLFASDVCLGELALEWARCRHCHLHKVRLNGTCVPSRYISGKCFPSFGREWEKRNPMTDSHSLMAQAEGLLRKVKDVLVFLLSNTLLFVVSAVSRRH